MTQHICISEVIEKKQQLSVLPFEPQPMVPASIKTLSFNFLIRQEYKI